MKTLQHCDIFYIHYYKTSGYDNGASMTAYQGFLFSSALIEAVGIHVRPVFSTAIYVPMVGLYSSATGVCAQKSKVKNYCIFKGNLEGPVLGGSIMGESVQKAPREEEAKKNREGG
ncbi:hypothetical protein A9K55_002453 [Cordyceps militaris]|uniref:Uncharacterized protein n=1 Tax=Cordyceps militaris TaxID=73501 RepID=A0A2H4S6R6_CORMI|nr:hypothetical protein A9K55_002453 [Cordyceps militaris]